MKDEYGVPKISDETGKPLFRVRGHDVEQFVDVVRRYGMQAGGVTELVEAANAGPEIAEAQINGACGNCLKR